jgi:hypothetical protein
MHAEYIAGKASYRSLAEKYGVSKDIIARRAKAEHWNKDRATARDKAATKVIQKTADAVANNAVKLEKAKGLAIDRIIRALERMPDNGGSHSRQTVQDGGKRLTVDHDLLDLVTALEKLQRNDMMDANAEPVKVVIDV